jgi:polar amino acid transport system substrate-binding protein
MELRLKQIITQKTKILYLTTMYCLLLCLGMNISYAQVESKDETAQLIKIATGESYFPFVDSSFLLGGWSKALVEATFSLMSVEVSFEILPWDRGLKWTQEAKSLGAFPYIASKQRSEKFLYSLPINFVPVRLYVASDSVFNRIEDIQGKRLCIPHGYSIGKAEQTVIDQFAMTINRAKDGIGCVGQVQRGWSDAGLTNGYIQAIKLRHHTETEEPIRIFPQALSSEPLYFLISKSYPDAQLWMDRFNQAFLQLAENGQKQQIDQLFLAALSKQ